MEWMELMVHTTSQGADIVSEILIQAGAQGTMIVDRNDIPDPSKPHGYWEIFDEAILTAMPEDVLVQAWFPLDAALADTLLSLQLSLKSLALSSLPFPLGSLVIEQKSVDEAAWVEKWKEYYKPFRPGNTLVIKPTWEPYTPKEGERVIEMDPGMAFGTGTHETTSMCLTLLEKYIKPNMTVVDIGTGSGILAIGAALLGANRVTAVDIDQDAVKVAKKNVADNGLSPTIEVFKGDLLEITQEKFDLCVANIISDVICFLAAPLKNNLKEKGLFICSGITKPRVGEVSEALLAQGYTLIEKSIQGEWAAMVWHS